MLARVKWNGDRLSRHSPGGYGYVMEYGTLLQFVYAGNHTMAMVVMDGHNDETRGKVIQLNPNCLRVTSFFNWEGEGYDKVQGNSKAPGATPQGAVLIGA